MSRSALKTAQWRKIRQAVLNRDGHACVNCGQMAGDGVRLEIDHIHRIADGGDEWDIAQLQTLCHTCHKAKTRRENSQPKGGKRPPQRKRYTTADCRACGKQYRYAPSNGNQGYCSIECSAKANTTRTTYDVRWECRVCGAESVTEYLAEPRVQRHACSSPDCQTAYNVLTTNERNAAVGMRSRGSKYGVLRPEVQEVVRTREPLAQEGRSLASSETRPPRRRRSRRP